MTRLLTIDAETNSNNSVEYVIATDSVYADAERRINASIVMTFYRPDIELLDVEGMAYAASICKVYTYSERGAIKRTKRVELDRYDFIGSTRDYLLDCDCAGHEAYRRALGFELQRYDSADEVAAIVKRETRNLF